MKRCPKLGATIVYTTDDSGGERTVDVIATLREPVVPAEAMVPLDLTMAASRQALYRALDLMGRPKCKHQSWYGFIRATEDDKAIVTATCMLHANCPVKN